MSARKLLLWSEYPLIRPPRIILGYLGGSVLSRLLAHPSRDTFEITAIVRSAEKAKKLEEFGVKTVVGSLKDAALVEQLSENAHIIFSIVRIASQNSSKHPLNLPTYRPTQMTLKLRMHSLLVLEIGTPRQATSPF